MDEFKNLENNDQEPENSSPIPEEVVEAVEEEITEEAANKAIDDTEEDEIVYDENGEAIYPDEPAEEIVVEPSFIPTIELDEEGNPVPTAVDYDEEGNPITPDNQYDATGKEYSAYFDYDEEGKPIAVNWQTTGNEWAPVEVPVPKRNYTLPIAIIVAVLVVVGLIVTLLPQLVPFNMTTKKFKSTEGYVRVQEQVLEGAKKQVYTLNGTTYVSVKGISDVFGYGAKKSSFSEKVKVDGNTYSIAHNAKRVNGKSLKHRIYAINKELFIAYEDASNVFPNLKTCLLGDTDTQCIYDPIPTVKAGKTIQDLIDQYAGQVDAETIKQQLHITDDKELKMDYYEYQASMSMSKYAEMTDSTIDDVFKSVAEQTGIDTSKFNEKTTYAEVQGAIPVAKMFGAEDEASLKETLEQYGMTKEKLGFKVTTKTLFSEVRNVLYLQQIDSSYQQEQMASSAAEAADEDKSEPKAQLSDEEAAEDTASTEVTPTPTTK